jgi:hypothetical protein
MPLSLFQARIIRLAKRREEEAKAEQAGRLFELYVSARSVSTALYLNNDPPLTPQQQKKKRLSPSEVAQIQASQESHKKLSKEWAGYALKSLKHFASYIGQEHVFGPPDERLVPTEEEKESAKQEARDRRERLIGKLRDFSETHGNVVVFEGRETEARKARSLASRNLYQPSSAGIEDTGLRMRLTGAQRDFEAQGKTEEAFASSCRKWAVSREALSAYCQAP